MSKMNRVKKIFNAYNLAVCACIILIICSIIIIFEPNLGNVFQNIKSKFEISTKQENSNDKGKKTNVENRNEEIKIVENKNKESISEKDAKKMAKKQFKELNEKVKEDDLQVLKVQRDGKEYYYISSEKNTIEISIETGKITRINSVKVEK